MRHYLLVATFIIVGNFSFAQNTSVPSIDKIDQKASPGSYQLIFTSENAKAISIDRAFLESVQNSRLENKENFIKVNDDLIVRILSYNQLQNGVIVSSEEEFIIDPDFQKP